MEAGLMEMVRSLNRNGTQDTCFSLYRAIHPGGNSGGNVLEKMSGYCLAYNTGELTILVYLSSRYY